jgi:hypothetical protein
MLLLLFAHRPVYRSEVAAHLGISEPALAKRLEKIRSLYPRLPRFARFNAFVLGMHATHVCDENGRPAPLAVSSRSFATTKSLNVYLRRHLGRSVRELLNIGGYTVLEAQLATWFVNRPSADA